MASLARWCFEHRWRVVTLWLLALVAVAAISVAAGTRFDTDLSLPGTDSQAAASLLAASYPAASGESDQVVIQATHGATIRSAAVEPAVKAALAKVAAVPGIQGVASPYGPGGAAQISRTGTVAFARVTWDKDSAQITRADARDLISAAETADGPDVSVSLDGPAITNSERAGLGRSVGVGIIAALIVLLIVFGGALLASLLPLVTALVALGIGASLVGLLSHAFTISSVSTQLAILIGLGVGVDYGLFIIGRYRSELKAGSSQPDAIALAVTTSGRTVLLAGSTVVRRPARPVRPGRQLPVRGIGASGDLRRPHHGHLTDLPARHARLPRTQGPGPARTASAGCQADQPARVRPASGSGGHGSSRLAGSSWR